MGKETSDGADLHSLGVVEQEADALSEDEQQSRMGAGEKFGLRLNLEKALNTTAGTKLIWNDRQKGPQRARPELFGDAVLARKDIHTSYHLAVVLDDALQEISLVTRGEDLFEATHLHRLLQIVRDLPVPEDEHHALINDEKGTRMAKRRKSSTLQEMRESGKDMQELRDELVNW